jgi:hypothetical protein
MDYTDIVSLYANTINETPYLLSLLYDINLLPEQVSSVQEAIYMAAIVDAYKEGLKEGLKREL